MKRVQHFVGRCPILSISCGVILVFFPVSFAGSISRDRVIALAADGSSVCFGMLTNDQHPREVSWYRFPAKIFPVFSFRYSRSSAYNFCGFKASPSVPPWEP